MCPFVCSSYNISIIAYNEIRTCYILKTETFLFFCSGEWTCYAYVHRTARNICPKGNMCSVPFCFLSFFPFFTFRFVCVSLLFVACFALSRSFLHQEKEIKQKELCVQCRFWFLFVFLSLSFTFLPWTFFGFVVVLLLSQLTKLIFFFSLLLICE